MSKQIGGEKRKEFAKKVGMAEFLPISFCPDKEELEQIFGTEVEKEPEYVGEKEGVTTVSIDVFLEEATTKQIFRHRIFLADKVVKDKTGTKTQFLNELGRQAWADDEANLPQKFIAYPYHEAKQGEADLISFLDAILDLDRSKPYYLEVDWKSLMAGNFKQLKDLLKTDLIRKVVTSATVRIDKETGEEYQSVYRKFLPEFTLKYFRTKQFDEESIEALRKQRETQKETKKYLKPYEEFVIGITDREHGCKDVYSLRPMKDYVPGEALQTSSAPISEEDDAY